MEMHASRLLAVSQQQAWEALNDPQTLQQCLAGCEKFEDAGDGSYAVIMSVKIGPVSAKFNGRVTLSDVQPPKSYTIAFEGQGGVAGFGKGHAEVRLSPDGEATTLNYDATAQVGGKIAQIGSRLVDSAARKIANEFFSRFNARMGGTAVGGAAIDSPPAALAQIDAGPEAGGTGPATEDLDTPKKGWLDRFRKTQ